MTYMTVEGWLPPTSTLACIRRAWTARSAGMIALGISAFDDDGKESCGCGVGNNCESLYFLELFVLAFCARSIVRREGGKHNGISW